MDDLYFGCDWIIRPHVNYKHLVDTAKMLNCTLVRVRPDLLGEHNLSIIRLAISVPSVLALDEFIDKAGKEIGMSTWHPVSKEYFETGFPFFNLEKTSPPRLWGVWLDGMNAVGKFNEEILRNLAHQRPDEPD